MNVKICAIVMRSVSNTPGKVIIKNVEFITKFVQGIIQAQIPRLKFLKRLKLQLQIQNLIPIVIKLQLAFKLCYNPKTGVQANALTQVTQQLEMIAKLRSAATIQMLFNKKLPELLPSLKAFQVLPLLSKKTLESKQIGSLSTLMLTVLRKPIQVFTIFQLQIRVPYQSLLQLTE